MKKNRFSAALIAGLLCLALLITLVPASAVAATQAEVDALTAERDELAKKRKEVKEKIDGLESERTSVLELKAALDERTRYNEE